nr:hypothetical protein [uncultured Roseovarius sp.]
MDDTRDGMLFRLWCRAASYPGGHPSFLSRLIQEECERSGRGEPAAYRRALLRYAEETGVNLP